MNIHKLIAAQVFAGLSLNKREWDTEEGMFSQALEVADIFSRRYDEARPDEQVAGPQAKSPARLAADAIKAARRRGE